MGQYDSKEAKAERREAIQELKEERRNLELTVASHLGTIASLTDQLANARTVISMLVPDPDHHGWTLDDPLIGRHPDHDDLWGLIHSCVPPTPIPAEVAAEPMGLEGEISETVQGNPASVSEPKRPTDPVGDEDFVNSEE